MITIKPTDFTDSQWVELYYASELLKVEHRRNAKAIKRSEPKVREAIACCQHKAKRERRDNSMGVDGAAWAADLRGAAQVLRGYVKGVA